MNANTVYDVFLALSDSERKRLIGLVQEYRNKEDKKNCIRIKKIKSKPKFTKKQGIDFLLQSVFTSKK